MAHMVELGCHACPRACGEQRDRHEVGYCRIGSGLAIASICLHQGEEPAIGGSRGICHVFFSHCNLQCLYCQNHQISRNHMPAPEMSVTEAASQISAILSRGIRHLGFVSPSHMLPQMRQIIAAVQQLGHTPIVVYNSNGYDAVESLRALEGLVDIYLPDFKYSDANLAQRYSGAADYPTVALRALREMARQKGTMLFQDEAGLATKGLIIRHLVLPGQVENSLGVLRAIAEELSPRIYLSLMAQYHPTVHTRACPPLDRQISVDEYQRVLDEMERLGFVHGWAQALDSAAHYNPDFERESPFNQSLQ